MLLLVNHSLVISLKNMFIIADNDFCPVIPISVFLWDIFLLAAFMAHAQVGKEFPDMRQSERSIKFIRVGDAVRTAGQLKGEPTLEGCPEPTLYPGYTRGRGVLRVIC